LGGAFFYYICAKADRSIAASIDVEESPGNTGHFAVERTDVREGIVTKKKITVPIAIGIRVRR
jgi:hypothetical protein